ncbi:MAG: hypothetical protein GXC72_04380 [Chitinophagaceae bacterium]|nr:hypothetical protein [Chitinophagaceae bacterium]
MARQNNLLHLTGTVGKLVSYERNGQYFTRSKPVSVTQTENTQKACVEFGRASAAASKLIKGFHPLLRITPHDKAYQRLTGVLTKMMGSSSAKAIGKRLVTDGDPAYLHHFRFNQAYSVDRALPIQIPPATVMGGSAISFTVPAFDLSDVRIKKTNVAGIRIEIICMVSDLLLDDGTVFRFDELDLLFDQPAFAGGSVGIPVADTHNKLVIWGMSVHYLDLEQRVSQNKTTTAFDIVDALLVKKGKRVVFATPDSPVAESTEPVERMPWNFRKPKQ